ncbi:methylmalonyl-CoA mutase family protein [Streptomyces sp. wa53]|uniref:methylmalonyl-CoA mutase family protein n=1 Tax=Streptomyces sp. wa53 TaxID=1828268 RepID=UPI003C7DBBC4
MVTNRPRSPGPGLPVEPVHGPGTRPGPWTTRRFTGSGTARESNTRYGQLIADGTTDLSVAFDLPTRMGHDSDAPVASGEVGRTGVAIDSVDDMRVLFAGIPLDSVSTSMTVDAPASLLLLLYQLVAEEQGFGADVLRGAIRNDVLQEYVARGTYIFPPKPALRLAADVFTYCGAEIPQWSTLSVSGHLMAEAGASPAQEIAFTLADGIEYVRAAVAAGLDVDEFAPRLSFVLMARTTAQEEAAGFRTARRIWARVMREEFGARNPESLAPRFRTQAEDGRHGAGRGGLSRERGGSRSPHPGSFEQALTPSAHEAARPAPRGLRALAYDTDVPTAAGLSSGLRTAGRAADDIEAATVELMRRVEDFGGAVAAIEHGYQTGEMEDNACRVPREAGSRERVSAGAGGFRIDEGGPHEPPREPLRVSSSVETRQAERLAKLRAWRDQDRVDRHLAGVRRAAAGDDNVLYPMKEALSAGATVGEVCDALREIWGTYTPGGPF